MCQNVGLATNIFREIFVVQSGKAAKFRSQTYPQNACTGRTGGEGKHKILWGGGGQASVAPSEDGHT